jgi:16S rRNA (adenine1518-N6/adenine1519-N6)-dimethyltransferase
MSIKALLRDHGLRPQKRLGQHFLVDRRILQQVLATAEVESHDTVLEVGAGLGTLTQALAERAHRVVAVEVDVHLLPALRSRLDCFDNIEVVQGDILALDVPSLLQEDDTDTVPCYKVVANIPYYITSALLRHLLEASARPQLIVLMVQREVARRITAGPGKMSLLAVSVQFYGSARLVARAPARAFYPAPKVDSAIVRIDPHKQLSLGDEDIGGFFRVVRAGFAQRRKQLRNALTHGLALPSDCIRQAMGEAGIEERRRAQSLSVDEWLALYGALKERIRPED